MVLLSTVVRNVGNLLGCAVLCAVLLSPANAESGDQRAVQKLDAAWNDLMQGLDEARVSLVDPQFFPAPATDRNLAEGYRYLLGHLNRIIEFELLADPQFPEFLRSMDMLRKWTGENPDAMYLKAAIDDRGFYKVTGLATDTSEWRSSVRGMPGPKAPRMVIFQTISGVPGDTGTLGEMAECKSQTLDHINSFELQVDADNRFELLIGPRRPEGYKGNFLLSRKRMTCPGNASSKTVRATALSVREIFSDWAREVPLNMDIVRLESAGDNRAPVNSSFMAEKLSAIGRKVPNQIRFWNQLMEIPLEMRGDHNGDGERALPVNGINPPAPPFTAAGAAGAGQLYAAGIFELGDDEALVIRVETPLEPHYMGFQLNNLWMEGPDQQNYVSSLNAGQLLPASDGARYYIVSHRDPGVPGWVDTTGLEKGFHAMRFIYRREPKTYEMPNLAAFRVSLAALSGLLPEGMPRVTAEQRRQEVALRQRHIKRRWRGF